MKIRRSIVCLLSVLIVPAVHAQAIQKQQLLAWTLGGMSSARLVDRVRTRHLSFPPDQKYLDLLRSAGAKDDLLTFLAQQKSVVPGAEPETSGYAGLLDAAEQVGKGNPEAAAKFLLQAAQAEPNNADLHFALAYVFRKLDVFDAAGAEYQKAIDLEPGFSEAHEGLSFVYYRLREGDEA